MAYCERNITECSYCKMKIAKADLDRHVEEEKGDYMDLVDAIKKGNMNNLRTMYEHGNNIEGANENDPNQNSLVHIAA